MYLWKGYLLEQKKCLEVSNNGNLNFFTNSQNTNIHNFKDNARSQYSIQCFKMYRGWEGGEKTAVALFAFLCSGGLAQKKKKEILAWLI